MLAPHTDSDRLAAKLQHAIMGAQSKLMNRMDAVQEEINNPSTQKLIAAASESEPADQAADSRCLPEATCDCHRPC